MSPYSIVRSGNYKLIHFYEENKYELYDLEKDTSESTDLAATNKELGTELKLKLDNWLKEIGAKLPKPNDKFKSNKDL